ncbi:MAG TPA: lysylphosphatidylglycerol synthase transmembrane domain-containing protein [Pseudomonadota bacterium]|nr:lysylphosphatidylglycerol synthase transmembrane domain-containing protein [Pseudomonadota bacterium]
MMAALHKAFVQLQGAALPYAGAALFLYALSVVMMGWRWQRVLRGMGQPVRLRDTSLTHLTSVFVNNVTPGRVAGEVFRVAMLRKRTGMETGRVIASLGWDRATDVVPLGLMVVLALPTLLRVLPVPAGSPRWLVGGGGVGLLVGLGLWWQRGRLQTLLRRSYAQLQAFTVRRRELGQAAFISCAVWAMDSARIWLVAAALGAPLRPWQAIPLSVVMVLGGLVPTIGGLGAIEGGLTAALCLFGSSLEQALAVTALERGISYVLATGAGGLALLGLGGGSLWRAARGRADSEREGVVVGVA